MRVYPRVCGGTHWWQDSPSPKQGLSPRMRGNPTPPAGHPAPGGSIPAYAGEPSTPPHFIPYPEVYPRVCGGTQPGRILRYAVCGLSPRMRGNRRGVRALETDGRSIPAYAGEPMPAMASMDGARVYPRVCGGTPRFSPLARARKGLSPRMRGNPWLAYGEVRTARSIPAYAGEPAIHRGCGGDFYFYPRVCGGTCVTAAEQAYLEGLSPRMRGNRARQRVRCIDARSIPAYAGEPPYQPHDGVAPAVYPRVCGGTYARRTGEDGRRGLSPRMRGNRRR